MRRNQQAAASATSRSALIVLRRRDRRPTWASRSRSRSATTTQINAVFRTANNIKPDSFVRIAGVNVGKVTDGRARRRATSRPRVVTMRIDKKGLPIHKDATLKIRPRIFLEGNFFVDIQPGLAVARRRSATATRSRSTRPARRSSSTRSSTSLQTDTRKDLQRAARRALDRPRQARAARGFNRSIPYWEPAYERRRDRRPTRARRALEHDLSRLHQERGRDRRGAGPQPRPAQEPHHRLQHDGRRVRRASDTALSNAIAELPRTLHAGLPALAVAQRRVPAAAALHPRRRGPAVRSVGPGARREHPVRPSSCAAGAAVRAARPGRTTCVPTVPALARSEARRCRSTSRSAPASSCQNEVILPWTQDKIQDTDFPADRPGLRGVDQAARRPRRREPLRRRQRPVVPRARLAGGNYAYPAGQQLLPDAASRSWASTRRRRRRTYPRPFKPDVPCETQQPPGPALRPASPAPTATKIDLGSSPSRPATQTVDDQGASTALRKR